MRSSADIYNVWKLIEKPILETLESLTGRKTLTAKGGTNFDFGSEVVKAACKKAAVELYRIKFPDPSTDSRIKTSSTLTAARLVSLVEEKISKDEKSKANGAKQKASRAKTQERASKRVKKAEGVKALVKVKTAEEVKQLESENVDAPWVQAKNSAREAILAAGYTQEGLDEALAVMRSEFALNPLGRSKADANKARFARQHKENLKILSDIGNTK